MGCLGGLLMGNKERSKGRRGQSEAKELLTSRDWSVAELSPGMRAEDFWACDLAAGCTYSVEVKNTISITKAHRTQAQNQAARVRLPWMLMSKIAGTKSWLIQRQYERPVVWHVGGK